MLRSQVAKKQMYKSNKAQGVFGDNKLTNSGAAKVSFKNLRGNKARKVNLSFDMIGFKSRLKNLDHIFRQCGNIL